ncbi:MAG: hypothetical protein MJ160_02200 [Treponema sp.]|nr:hypothetical protein [Treponema sp.]
MKKNQTYKTKNYDFSDYAEEIKGDALFKINGGAEAMSPADQADMATALRNGDTETAASIMAKYQNTETPTPPATYGNTPDSTSGVDTGNGNSETSNNNSTNTTSENHPTISIDLPTIPENIRNNPHALAYYMAKQAQAKAEGDPDKFKGYNVLGEEIKGKDLESMIFFYGKRYRAELDSTGRQFIYDFTNKKINVKIEDRNALQRAAEVLSDLYVEGYAVNAITSDGNIREFTGYKQLLRYMQYGDKNLKEEYVRGGENIQYIENNQLKSEQKFYFEKISDYDYYEINTGLINASSKLLGTINNKSNPIDFGVNYYIGKAEALSCFDKNHLEKSVSISLLGIDFSIGYQNPNFSGGITFGGNLGESFSVKYINTPEKVSMSADFSLLFGIGGYLEFKK